MSIARREMLAGGLMLGALGLGTWLAPRTPMKLKGDRTLASIVPENFDAWQSAYDPGLIVPIEEGSLTSVLYDELLTRRYINSESAQQIFLLIAYGGTQTDSLQLHRPESCYPALGLAITQRTEFQLALPGTSIPSVALVAKAPGRTEDIVYWTRMGPLFPQSASAQRSDKLNLAMRGIIPDGILIRASLIRDESQPPRFDELKTFLSELVSAVAPSERRVFAGATAGPFRPHR